MLRILKRALAGGTATSSYPVVVTEPPDGFRGKPQIDFSRCTACTECAAACPTGAISVEQSGGDRGETEKIVSINYGDCIFCGECEAACPGAIAMSKEFQLAATDKEGLVTRARYLVSPDGNSRFDEVTSRARSDGGPVDRIGARLKERIDALFGRSLHIREVDAGSCNGCEIEITALSNPIYDIERFGVHFVASPRHADMLLVTGPVTRNMQIALKETYEATPDPKFVVAVGACAIGGGVYGKTFASCGGVDTTVPVDVYIPGCPPRPEALLHGILLAMDRYPRGTHRAQGASGPGNSTLEGYSGS